MRLVQAFAMLLFASACERSGPSEPGPAPSASFSPETFRAQAVASALAGVRSRLSLAAPAWPSQPLAFGRRLLVRVLPDRVETFRVPELTLAYERPLPGALAVGGLAQGSLLVVGSEAALRIDPGAKAAAPLPPVVWVPGTELVPERRDPGLFWALQRGSRLLARQRLQGPRPAAPAPEDIVTLESYEGGALAALRDGTILYAASDGVRHGHPGFRSKPWRPSFEPWRLLPGRRIDQAWAIGANGAVELWQLTDRLVVVTSFALGAPPFDAAASSDHLAAVVVDEGKDHPRRFRLVVHGNDGARVLERALPEGPPPSGENWAELAVRDRHVALSDGEPLVAVGGPGALLVLRLPGGEVALQR
ncbi:MAG TPA: hypothetical protein VGK73_21665 [Polyangiaceae bacterium]